MDPEVALAALREWARTQAEEGDSAVEAFTALDEWLSRGGFLPADWAAGR